MASAGLYASGGSGDREVSRNSITTECADFQTVGEPVLKPISARASAGCGGETPSMNVMVVALAE